MSQLTLGAAVDGAVFNVFRADVCAVGPETVHEQGEYE